MTNDTKNEPDYNVEGDLPGDEDWALSFEQIHRKYQERIFALILRLVRDRDDAEDLTVETFMNAYRHWGRFRGEARVYTWLHQIAVNNCKNRFKQNDRRREREPVSLDDSIETDGGELSREVADWRNAPERLLLDGELAQRVEEAVDALPPEYRTVLVLALQDDLSYEDIARITGLSVPAVKTRLHRARNRVKQIDLRSGYKPVAFDGSIGSDLVRESMAQVERPAPPERLRRRLLTLVHADVQAVTITVAPTARSLTFVRRVFVSDVQAGNTRSREWHEYVEAPHPDPSVPAVTAYPCEPGPRCVKRIISVSVFGPSK